MKDHPEAKGAINNEGYVDEEEDMLYPDESIGEIFWSEFSLVWRTFGYVLKSWVEMPGKAFKILVFELNRLWSYWLGLPVTQRSWEFQWRPQTDEL